MGGIVLIGISAPLIETPIDFEWVDPLGNIWPLLHNDNINVKVGEKGLGLPSVKIVADKMPSSAGAAVRYVEQQERVIDLTLHCSAGSLLELDNLMSSIYQRFSTASEEILTPGKFRMTRADATQREIGAYYVSGLEGDNSPGVYWQTSRDVTIRLECPNPWPQDLTDQVFQFTSSTWASFNIINPGERESFPIWSITGPAAGISLFNTDTGEGIVFTGSIAAGKVLVFDTRLSNDRTSFLQIYDSDGLNRMVDTQIPATKLWRLASGANHVSMAASGTSGASRLNLNYRPQYNGFR